MLLAGSGVCLAGFVSRERRAGGRPDGLRLLDGVVGGGAVGVLG